MSSRLLRGFTNGLIVAYALDAALSLFLLFAESGFLGLLRDALAMFVVLQCVVAIPLLGLTRKLPLSVFVPIIVSAFWLNVGAIPLLFYVEASVLERQLVLCQCAVALGVSLRVRSLRSGEGWLFDLEWFSGRLFSLPYFLGYQIAAFSLLLISVFLVLVAGLVSGVDVATKGFVRFDAQGISLADRTYEDYGNRVRLVGMMHIGEDEGYRTLFRDLGRGSSSMLVLTEGVSDFEGLLSRQYSYGPLAEALGVGEQQAIEDYVDWEGREDEVGSDRPIFMNADLDVSEFDPATVELLGEIGEIYRGDDLLAGFFEVYGRMRGDPEASASFTEDIIGRRNRYVIAHIIDFKEDYREIVVPWGAMHLPGIEAAIENMGFVRSSTRYIQFISWRRLAEALLGGSGENRSGQAVEDAALVP